jgi:hypothetical protein
MRVGSNPAGPGAETPLGLDAQLAPMVEWPTSLGVRLAVGHLTLDQVAQVRILDPQPSKQVGEPKARYQVST